ncbi:hypothetical protein T08_6501 [Trichinella sp. T8]|nr:hypothetical protein T08_6501 [Trichinella sp. T8]
MDVAFDASHNDSLVFVFLPHDVHAVHSSFTRIILHKVETAKREESDQQSTLLQNSTRKRNPFSSGATYIKALRNCSSVSTAGLKSKVMVKTSGNCTIGFLHQKLEQSVKPKFASTGIFVQPIMPTFQVKANIRIDLRHRELSGGRIIFTFLFASFSVRYRNHPRKANVIEPYVSRHLVKWAPQYCSRED